jgi:hypothetical protein
MSKSLLSLFCRKNVRRRWFAVPYCIILGRRMQFAGTILVLPPENANKLQKMLQISHQKGRFAIDSLVIIEV